MQVGTLFALIFAVIMMGAIMAFGFDQIVNMFGVSGQAQLQKDVKNIETLTEEVYHMARGSSRTYTIRIPTGTKLCFINTKNPGRAVYLTSQKERWWCPGNPDCESNKDDNIVDTYMIVDQHSEYYNSNVWIYHDQESLGVGVRVPHLAPECDSVRDACSFCTISGMELYLENKGLFVEVSVME